VGMDGEVGDLGDAAERKVSASAPFEDERGVLAPAILGRGEGVDLDAVPENRPRVTQDGGARRDATTERAERQGKPKKGRRTESDLRKFNKQDQRSGRHLGSATSLVDVW